MRQRSISWSFSFFVFPAKSLLFSFFVISPTGVGNRSPDTGQFTSDYFSKRYNLNLTVCRRAVDSKKKKKLRKYLSARTGGPWNGLLLLLGAKKVGGFLWVVDKLLAWTMSLSRLLLYVTVLVVILAAQASAQRCGGRRINRKKYLCCEGRRVRVSSRRREYYECCGAEAIDTRRYGCCRNERYDKRDELCCQGKVRDLIE